MGEKTKMPFISDTVEIDGIFYVEQRVATGERRKVKSKRVLYERRFQSDPREKYGKHIDEESNDLLLLFASILFGDNLRPHQGRRQPS